VVFAGLSEQSGFTPQAHSAEFDDIGCFVPESLRRIDPQEAPMPENHQVFESNYNGDEGNNPANR
jgi:hypothetical protein